MKQPDRESQSFFRLGIRPWGMLTAAGVVACLATLIGFLGRFWWFFDLFSHFRVQYLGGLLVLGAILLVARRRKTAILFLVFACANLLMVVPLYLGGLSRTPDQGPIFRAMLLNVNTRLGDPNRVKRVIRDTDPDIVVLEEISSKWMANLTWLAESHPHSVTRPREDNFGIGLFSKLPLSEGEIVYIGESEVPSILATVRTGQKDLRVIATHPLPPIGRENSRLRNEQLYKLPEYVQSQAPVLLLGDLNTTPWNYHFRQLVRRSGLSDSSRGYGVQASWPSHIPLLRLPIDHCLHSSDVAIIDRRIGENVASDHYPLIVDFAIPADPTDNGLARQAPAKRE